MKNEVRSEYDFIDLDSGSEDVEENNHEGAKEKKENCTVPKISLVPLQGRVGDGVDFLLIFF